MTLGLAWGLSSGHPSQASGELGERGMQKLLQESKPHGAKLMVPKQQEQECEMLQATPDPETGPCF